MFNGKPISCKRVRSEKSMNSFKARWQKTAGMLMRRWMHTKQPLGTCSTSLVSSALMGPHSSFVQPNVQRQPVGLLVKITQMPLVVSMMLTYEVMLARCRGISQQKERRLLVSSRSPSVIHISRFDKTPKTSTCRRTSRSRSLAHAEQTEARHTRRVVRERQVLQS